MLSGFATSLCKQTANKELGKIPETGNCDHIVELFDPYRAANQVHSLAYGPGWNKMPCIHAQIRLLKHSVEHRISFFNTFGQDNCHEYTCSGRYRTESTST